MDPAPEVERLFHEVVDLSPSARQAYFEQHRVGPEIRRELEALLLHDLPGENDLIEVVGAAAASVLTQRSPAAGRRCGPYRLVRVLGHGGMGSVHLAERADGEVEQRVAIKLLRWGGDEPAFRDRFLRERQILATLNHPGIARLLDAGHTSEGQPYLIMDYIDGTPIDVYAAGLDPRAKLRLFLQVCEAVSYAHRNLVIHRDIKPSNILVDRPGNPKLLDFGIAKILEPGQDETQTRDAMLTPGYASPEQVRGAAQSTATDIYSLGTVLYKLLTGRLPCAAESANPDEILSAVTSKDPALPSRLNRNLPRDLDFVLAKALRKEPEERYATVEAFADDLRAVLEWRPVRARSGDAWYRMRKFARRYWAPIGVAAVVVVSLAAGLYVANRERSIAQRRFHQVRQLANRVLALDGQLYNFPGSIKARQEIVHMSQEYLEGLRAEAAGDQDLAIEVADAYLKLARAQGVPIRPNLGQQFEAGQSLRKADALVESVLQISPQNRRALLLSAQVAHDRMILANGVRRNDEALAQARKAAARLDALMVLGKPSQDESIRAAQLFTNLALAHKNLHLYDDSVRYARSAVQLGSSIPSSGSTTNASLSIMADSLRYSGDLNGALYAIQQAREAFEKNPPAGEYSRRADLSNLLWREGVILGQDDNISLERPAEAAAVLQHALDLNEQWARGDPNDANSRILLAQAARDLGLILHHTDPGRALDVFDHALFRLGEIKNANPTTRHDQIRLLAYSSYPLRALHRQPEARRRIDEALRMLREDKQYPAESINPDDEADATLRALGDHLAETNQPRRAAEVYGELLDKTTAFRPDPQNDLRHATQLSRTNEVLARLYRQIGKREEAAILDSRRLQIWRHWQTKLPNNPFVLRQIAAVSAK